MVESYLTSRFQCVKIGDSYSEFVPVLSGVVQGSVLGPLLFVIFIDDLPQCFRSATPYLYVDDTKCIKSVHNSTDIDLAQNDIDCLFNWNCTWRLTSNISKLL